MEMETIVAEDSSVEIYSVQANKPNTETECMLMAYKYIKEINNRENKMSEKSVLVQTYKVQTSK